MYEEMLDDQEDDGRIVSEMEQANKKFSLKQATVIIVVMLLAVRLNQLCCMVGLPSTEGCLLMYVTAKSKSVSYGLGGG
jgi:hypothetical protein